ncbi:hypothetical protein Gotur_000369 [Gossypium turneri]
MEIIPIILTCVTPKGFTLVTGRRISVVTIGHRQRRPPPTVVRNRQKKFPEILFHADIRSGVKIAENLAKIPKKEKNLLVSTFSDAAQNRGSGSQRDCCCHFGARVKVSSVASADMSVSDATGSVPLTKEAKMKKICLFLAILVLVFCNSMATSIETNSTVSVIADFDDLEFLMDSHFGRVLQSSGSVSRKSLNPGQAAVNCGRVGLTIAAFRTRTAPLRRKIAGLTTVPAAGERP